MQLPALEWHARPLSRLVATAALVLVSLASGRALAIGEPITDVRVLDNQRTEESTVRSIAGISIGDTLEADTLDRVRERLNTAGLFSDVNVWWEPHQAGVRVNVAVKDKFPWAPVPTASFSANNKAAGLVFVHGNLFGRGKQFVLGARVATVDSGAVLAYRDPAMFGSWIYWQLQGNVQRLVIPEYDSYGPGIVVGDPFPIRESRFVSYGFEVALGIAWFRRVKTQFAWRLENYDFNRSDDPMNEDLTLVPTTRGGTNGMGKASITFDFRAREFSVMTGTALSGSFDTGSPTYKGDFTFWRVGASFEHGIKFFKSHNLIYNLYATTGENLPFWNETTAGGPTLRGFLYQQFRGDTQLAGRVEYHFPLFSIASLDFRALGFYDAAAIWFRDLPPVENIVTQVGDPNVYFRRNTPDQRTFPQVIGQGFELNRNVHHDVGGGLRFFLRSVAVPLVGFDAGYGIDPGARRWRFILIIGA